MRPFYTNAQLAAKVSGYRAVANMDMRAGDTARAREMRDTARVMLSLLRVQRRAA